MTLKNLHKTPFPWFGGKADAAPAVWEALGDVDHYMEPFAGSLAVLLRRPHPCNRTYYSETVNDLDGLLVNAWRAIALAPDATAEAASWPVAEADLMARHIALVKWRNDHQLERLMTDPHFHDPVMAGWWLWGQSSWIGSGWCSGDGKWTVGADGRIKEAARNHAGTREPGVSSRLPHLSDNGRGVNRPQTREPGVSSQLPHLSNNGMGVNHAGTREPGVESGHEYHPMTMPELRRWMHFLSARLRHVRILNGDWTRAVKSGALKSLPVRSGGVAGVFLDPPYSYDVRGAKMYAQDSGDVSADVLEWCKRNGNDKQVRVVLAGYDSEHTDLTALGWRCVEWYRSGFLRGGMGNQGGTGTQQHRERLWLSPHCIAPAPASSQLSLFGAA